MVSQEIIVEISLASSENGGRFSSIVSGEYRGVFGVGGEHFSVRWLVPSAGLDPGGLSGTFRVQFLLPEVALPYFPPGTEFSVWEGRVIGSGRVLEVVAPSASAGGA